MKLRLLLLTLLAVPVALAFVVPQQVRAQEDVLTGCQQTGGDDSFLGLPTWYRGLPTDAEGNVDFGRKPTFSDSAISESSCVNPIVLIGANIVDALLRIAGVVAAGFVIVGGFKYTLSDGNPQKATEARQTIINALIGAAIAAMGSTIITVIVNRL